MANERLDDEQIKEAAYHHCREQVKGKHVLAIQDTTELNYQKHAGRRSREDKELGPVGDSRQMGFFLHPTLVVDTAALFPLGFSSVYEWNREWEQESKEQRKYRTQPIEAKESYRWLQSAETSKRALKEASRITVIGDRESDIYEELATVPDERCDLLIRSAQNRKLYDRKENLFAYLRALPVMGEMDLVVKGNKNRADRTARLEIRYARVQIARPQIRSARHLPAYVEVYAIEVREKADSVPSGEEPILWRLLTTHEVKTLADALQYVRWYSWRWWIEELFRVLKTKGLCLESAQYESGQALKRLALLALPAALRIMQLKAAREGNCEVTPESVFSQDELEFQERLLPRVEGKTLKQKNPHPRTNLGWSAWIIARLGGWKTVYSKDKPPGVITMKRGLECFYQQYHGWNTARSPCR